MTGRLGTPGFRVGPLVGALAVLAALAVGTPPVRADFVGHGAPVRDVAISSDGRYAATAGFDDLAILWSVESRDQLTRLYGHEAGVNAVAFLPPLSEGLRPRLVTVSDDGTARIWDGATGTQLHVLTGHTKKVVAVAVSPDGTQIATASWDRTVRLWNAETGATVSVLEGHTNSVNDLVFTPDGSRIVSAGYDGDIRAWPLDGGEAYRFAQVGFPINALAISGDGKILVTGSADKTVRVWDMATRDMLREMSDPHDGAVLTVAVSREGMSIASGGVGGTLLIWDGGAEPRIAMQVEHYRAVWALEFSPSGDRIYAAGIDSVVRAWRTSDGASIVGEATRFQPLERVSRALANSDDPVERGSFQFRKCAICHALEEGGPSRSGPSLAGLFGRRAGSYPGYDFSDALHGSEIVWTEETVDLLFDIGPDKMFPGTKMPIQRLTDPGDRRDLVEFLKQATD